MKLQSDTQPGRATTIAIQEHNAKNLSWTLGLNQFSDLSPEEFSALHLGFKLPTSSSPSFPSSLFPNIPGFP